MNQENTISPIGLVGHPGTHGVAPYVVDPNAHHNVAFSVASQMDPAVALSAHQLISPFAHHMQQPPQCSLVDEEFNNHHLETYVQTPTYDDIFPALPEVDARQLDENAQGTNGSSWTQAPKATKFKSSNVTHVFRVAPEERRYRESNNRFGEQVEQSKVCASIMQETGTHIETSSSRDGTLTFLITGKEQDVAKAKRAISSELQTQASTTIAIPKEHHKFILGKKGDKLSALEQSTGTKIYVPRQGDTNEQIKILGTKDACDKAAHEIQLISNEAASRSSERLNIPKEYHPFILGPFNENLNYLINETGAKINIPPNNVMKDEISINGELNAVKRAAELILAIYDDRKKKTQTVSMEVKKQQHRYIIGPRGSTLQEIFKKTGVSVEMPPTDTMCDTITLRGEQDKLGPALSLIYEKAHSEIDNEIPAENWIWRRVLGPKAVRLNELALEFPNVNVSYSDDKIKMHGPRGEMEKATEVFEREIKEIRSNVSVETLKVNPDYHRFIIGKNGQNIKRFRDETGAHIHIPSETDNRACDIITIEGSHDGVAKAKKELEAIIKKLVEREKEISKDLIIEQRFHRQIIGAKGEKIREIRDKFNQVVVTFPDPTTKSDKVSIRGAKEDVDKCYSYLAQHNKELLASNFRAEVPIFKQYHRVIIGKEGANIKKIREETDTRIELPDEGNVSDVIVITGRKDNVEKAKKMIEEVQSKQMNFHSLDIIIPAKFHNTIIGAKGRLIKSIMEDCGGVVIKFPSEGSGSDKVNITGPKECVLKAKQQLIELSNDKQTNSFSVEIKAKPEYHKFLIGKNGSNIKKIRENSNAKIFFPSEKDPEQEIITIEGKKEDVAKAQKDLEDMIRELQKVTEDEVRIDPKYHRHFVQRRGYVLKKVQDDFGNVSISFPKATERESDRVRLKGAKECIEGAKARLLEIVEDLASHVDVECEIEQQHHRSVMGTRGYNVQKVQQDYNVRIKFPERANTNGVPEEGFPTNGDTNGSNEIGSNETLNSIEGKSPKKKPDVIVITGKLEDCNKAKQALIDLVPITEEVEVPFDYHRFIIGQKGREVRELMETYDVNITVPHSSEQSDIIRVKGVQANVDKAKQALLDRVVRLDDEKQERLAKSFKIEISVDPQFHPKIIGKRGAIINKIRDKHDVQIHFPERNSSEGSADLIAIVGYESNVNAAKDAIMKIVDEYKELVTEELEIDYRVHPRLIGAKGKNIRKLMDQFKVDIKFPREKDQSQVFVTGSEENVEAAKDHLLMLTEEYLDDVDEKYTVPSRNQADSGTKRASDEPKGFFVSGGPWQQNAPNTEDTEEFPSMAGGLTEQSSKVSWGPSKFK